MNSSQSNVRAPVPGRILWKWTTVSAVLHLCFIGGLCYSSFLQTEKREAALKAKMPVETPATPEESPRAEPKPESPASAQQSTPASPKGASPNLGSGTASAAAQTPSTASPAPPDPKPAAPAPQAEAPKQAAPPEAAPGKGTPPSAEKILGIDKVAKPDDAPKGANPFSGKDDDLLKDLK